MAYDKSAADALLKKLEEHLEKAPDFTGSELAALHEMVNAWKGWQALGRAAKWVIVTLGLIAGFVASWSSLVGAFKDWLRS